jgi:hypothetical protein
MIACKVALKGSLTASITSIVKLEMHMLNLEAVDMDIFVPVPTEGL